MNTKWFKKGPSTGWRKTQSAETRRRKLMDATDKRRTRHNRYVEAGRIVQALANVTKDQDTKRKATADAQYFFKKAQRT